MPASTAADGGQTIIFAGTTPTQAVAARQSGGGSGRRTAATERARAEGSLACSRHDSWGKHIALCFSKSLTSHTKIENASHDQRILDLIQWRFRYVLKISGPSPL